jgi:hypothetical protein
VGYGSCRYKPDRSSQEGEWPITGFSPRKQVLIIYVTPGFGPYSTELANLGMHTHSVGCLYIKRSTDVSVDVLMFIIKDAARRTKEAYPTR